MLQAVALAFVCLFTSALPALVQSGDQAVGQLLLKGRLRDPWLWLTHEFNREVALGSLEQRGPPATRSVALFPSRLPPAARNLSLPEHCLANCTSSPDTGPPGLGQPQHFQEPEPHKVRVFIGVFTGLGPRGVLPYSKYDYAARREVARRTWIPGARQYDHVAVRFVVGRFRRPSSRGGTAAGWGQGEAAAEEDSVEAALAGAGTRRGRLRKKFQEEIAQEGDFMQLDVPDIYNCMVNKTRAFFVTVARTYPNVEWVIKIDDDAYLLPPRLLMAADQWTAMGADLVGCMLHGPAQSHRGHRWFEPMSHVLGLWYPLRVHGTMYVLSGRVVRHVAARGDALRLSHNGTCCPEDVTVTLWMLASGARFFDDTRTCRRTCSDAASVALYEPRAMGMALGDIVAVHMDPRCHVPVPWPPPYSSSTAIGLEPWHEGQRDVWQGSMRV